MKTLVSTVVSLVFTANLFAAEGKPLKVFILAGQSNMEGQAVADLDPDWRPKDYNFGRGSLARVMKETKKPEMFAHLVDKDGQWSKRDDVWVHYKREDGATAKGPLGVGYAVYMTKHHFGPELEFGHVVGKALDEQVLIIKTAWGGKSLVKDFRPPSSGGSVGHYYTLMIEQVRDVLSNLKREFPEYDGKGYEIAGLVWYQGWNDGVDPKKAIPEYEQNLVNLINDVRKDLKSSKLLVVIGELTGAWVDAPPEWEKLRKAQADAADRPEFRGNVLFVPTRNYVRKPEDSPNPGHGHHEFGNAETYFLVGKALGEGMLKLLAK